MYYLVMLRADRLYINVKEYFFSFIILLTILLTIINFCFLLEFNYNDDLRDFFYKGESLNVKFSQVEISHLQDVKDLVINLIIINLVLIFVSVFVFKKANRIIHSLFFFVLMLFVIVIFFDYFFYEIHYLLFNNLNWQLPSNSLLLQTYPISYFRNVFIMILALFILFSVVFERLRIGYFK